MVNLKLLKGCLVLKDWKYLNKSRRWFHNYSYFLSSVCFELLNKIYVNEEMREEEDSMLETN